jgi:hypothetical protein
LGRPQTRLREPDRQRRLGICEEEETMVMRWLALGLVLCFCMSCCFCDDDGEEPGPDDTSDGGPTPTPMPGPSQVIDSGYVRVSAGQLQTLTWTSTGPGDLTADISWTGAAIMTLYLDKGGIVAQQSGSSPLQVTAHAAAAGELWTIGIHNDSALTGTVAYTLTFQSD